MLSFTSNRGSLCSKFRFILDLSVMSDPFDLKSLIFFSARITIGSLLVLAG